MELQREDIERLIEDYPIGRLIGFARIKQGFMNYSYVISTEKGKFILRIGKKTKEEKDILFEIDLLNHLKGLPTTKYVQDKNGVYVSKFRGHNYSIYKYIKGSMPEKISGKVLKQLAHFLARFHNQTRDFDVDQERFAWYAFSDQRADEFEKYLLDKLGEYGEEIEYLKSELLKNRLPGSLPSGPIHCDVKRHNILVIRDRLTGVVDFDNCQIGPYLLDLAISITWFCTGNKDLDYKKAYRFVRHYEKFRKLNPVERKYLFQAIRYAYISHEFVDYYVYAKGIIDEGYFQFGRKFFLTAAKKMDKNRFSKHLESPVAFLYNLF